MTIRPKPGLAVRRRLLVVTGLILVTSATAVPMAADTEPGSITVEFTGLTSDEGSVVFAMWDSPEGWLEEDPIRSGSAPIVDGGSHIVFDELPYGEYAISAYHDKNANEKLDTGLFGIPKEPIGTSNDAKARFGPPKYDDARFDLVQPDLTITIPIRKLF